MSSSSYLVNKLRTDLERIKSDPSGEIDVRKLLDMWQNSGLENGIYFLHDIKVYTGTVQESNKINCYLILHKFLEKLDSLNQEIHNDYFHELICTLVAVYQYQMLNIKSNLDNLNNICEDVRKDRADERAFYEQLFEESEDNYRQLNKEWTNRFSRMEKSYLETQDRLKEEYSNKLQSYLDDINDIQYTSNISKQKINDLEQKLILAEKQNISLCEENRKLQERILELEKNNSKQSEYLSISNEIFTLKEENKQMSVVNNNLFNEFNVFKENNDCLLNDLAEIKERNVNLCNELNEIKKTNKIRQKKKQKLNQMKKSLKTSETQTVHEDINLEVRDSNKNDIGVQVNEEYSAINNNQFCSYCDCNPTFMCAKLRTVLTWVHIERANIIQLEQNYRIKIHNLNIELWGQTKKLKAANEIIDRMKTTDKIRKSLLTHKDILVNEISLEVKVLEAQKIKLQKELEKNEIKNSSSWIFSDYYLNSRTKT